MAEFSSEIGSFLQQKRDRNLRLVREDRQRRSGAAGQLSQQIGQKIGWKQAAEQVNVLGRQNLADWVDKDWTEIARTGVDPILQDINFRVQQSTAELQGQRTTTTDVKTGETRDMTTTEQTASGIITANINREKDKINDNYRAYLSTPEAQEALTDLNNASPADLLEVSRQAVAKMEIAKKREDYKTEWIDNFTEDGFDTTELQAQTTLEGVRNVVAPKMQADILRDADAKLAKTTKTADDKTINTNLKEITGSDKMVKIISSLKMSEAFKGWFDENGNITDEILKDNRKFGYIRELSTKYDTEVKARVDESKLREEQAAVASGKVKDVEQPVMDYYSKDPKKAFEMIENMKLLAKGLLHQKENHGLRTEASSLYIDSKNDIIDFYGNKVVEGDDAKIMISQIKSNPNYLENIDTATREYEKVDDITKDLTNIAFNIVQGNPLIKFQKPEASTTEAATTDTTQADEVGSLLDSTDGVDW